MKTIRFIILLTLSLFLIVTPLFSGSNRQNGTAGALELLIPPDASGAAMGGHGVAFCQGIDAVHWNPAGIALTQSHYDFMVSRLAYWADIEQNAAALLSRMNNRITLALHFKHLSYGRIAETTEWAPDGTGSTFSPGFSAVGLSLGIHVTDRLQWGAAMRYLNAGIADMNATGLCFNIGFLYAVHSRWRVGIALRNWGRQMTFDGEGLNRTVYLPGSVDFPVTEAEPMRIKAEGFELPAVVDIGFSWLMLSRPAYDCYLNGTFQNRHLGWDHYGLAMVWQARVSRTSLEFKAGLQGACPPSFKRFVIHDESHLLGPGAGFGFVTPFVSGSKIVFQYACMWAYLFDNCHWFSMGMQFR